MDAEKIMECLLTAYGDDDIRHIAQKISKIGYENLSEKEKEIFLYYFC